MPTLKEKLAAAKANQTQTKQPTLKEKLTQKNAPEAEPEYERNWYDAPRAALQGATMGWSDELGAGAGALAAKTAQLFNDDETSLGNIYDQMKGNINKERKAYEKANPAEAIGLNLAGGMLTGGAGAGKVLASQTLKNAGRLKKTLALAGLGSVEGAIAGAGSADEGKRGEGAVLGGTVGAVLPLAMGGGRKALDVISDRRVQRELTDTAGNFLPINQAADEGSTLGNIYQKIVAPSFGGQQLREQNRSVLNRTVKALDEAKLAKETAKTTGKQTNEAALRNKVKMESLPNNVSEEFKSKILQSDGHEAIQNIDQAWNQGFKVVKDKTFNLNPKELVDSVVEGLDSPMDAEFKTKIASAIRNKLKGGFTASTEAPNQKFVTKGMGSQKAPQVDLDSGEVDGAWLMQARNDLRMRANELNDAGADALEVNALKSSARKIDDLIRENLDEAEVGIFDKELKNWGNYQTAKGSTRKAGTNQQGKYEPQQLLQTARTNQQRKFDKGIAPFQKEAQDLQVSQKGIMDRADKQIEFDEAALKEVKGKLPNINPDPWSKTVATATLGGAPLAAMPIDTATKAAAVLPFGYGLGKVASYEPVQKALAGQTGLQKTIANLLRQYDDSGLQKGVQAGQGALSREYIMQMNGE